MLLVAGVLLATDLGAQSPDSEDPLRWSAAPDILPPGARIAVVSGDPTRAESTTIELIMPDGYRMPPHTHPADEHVEVKEGTLLVGIGDKVDPEHTVLAEVGDTGTAPAGAHHYTIARGRTRVRVRFMGPYTITYLDASEAPRRRSFPFGY